MVCIKEILNLSLHRMKNVLAFILLLSHVNFSMFIAQVDEMDVFDKNGQQKEDVNSLIQYVAELFHLDHKPIKDSDDDNARYFHLEKLDYSLYQEQLTGLRKPNKDVSEKTVYAPYMQNKIAAIFFDIQSPPPEVFHSLHKA